jgi:hypothetical protein
MRFSETLFVIFEEICMRHEIVLLIDPSTLLNYGSAQIDVRQLMAEPSHMMP